MLKKLKLSDIKIPEDRQRKEFAEAEMQELIAAISTNGLLHPITVREDAQGKYYLVAGERRLRVLSNMHELGLPLKFAGESVESGLAPCISVGFIDELEAQELEWLENQARAALTWQDRAQAIQKLSKLRKAQAEVQGEVYTPKQLTAEVYGEKAAKTSQTYVKQQLYVAEHMDDPDVVKAPTIKEAVKVVENKLRREENVKRAVEAEDVDISDRYKLHKGDCLSWMRDSANFNTVDVVLTDPPYGMGANRFGDGAGKMGSYEHQYDDSHESWQVLMTDFCKSMNDVCKPAAHAYLFCDLQNFYELKGMLEEQGWKVFRTPLLHIKVNSGRVPWPETGPRRSYECILYAVRGGKTTTNIFPDYIMSQFAKEEKKTGHGAQKPISLFVDLLMRSVRPNDLVLDGFAGSGTIFPAAHQVKVRAVGCEKDLGSIGQCMERMEDLSNQIKLEM